MSARKLTLQRVAAGAGVAALAMCAAVMSYEHQRHLAATHGQSGLSAALWPLAVDGLILACGIQVTTDRAGGYRPRTWAVAGFWLGVVVSVTANALATPGGAVARAISALPAVALLVAVEALTTRPKRRPVALPVGESVAESAPTALPEPEPVALPTAPLPAVVSAAQGTSSPRPRRAPVASSSGRTDDELIALLADVPREADGTIPVTRARAALGCGVDRARRLLATAGLLRTAAA